MSATEHDGRRKRDPHRASGKSAFYRACWKNDGDACWTYADVRDSEREATADMWRLAGDAAGQGTVLSAQAASASAALSFLVYEEERHHAHAFRGDFPWGYAVTLAAKLQAVTIALEEKNARRIRETKAAAVLAVEPLRWSTFGPERRAMALACDATEIAVHAATPRPESVADLDRLAERFVQWSNDARAEARMFVNR